MVFGSDYSRLEQLTMDKVNKIDEQGTCECH